MQANYYQELMKQLAPRQNNSSVNIFYDSKRDIWRGDIRYKVGGEKKRTSVSGKTKEDVEKKVESKKLEILKTDLVLITENVTFSDIAESWMLKTQKLKLKDSSYDTKYRTYRDYVRPHIGNIKMDQLTFDDVQTMVTNLSSKEGLSYSVVKKAYLFVSECAKYYKKLNNLVFFDPCSGIVLPEKTKKEISEHRYFIESEREKIIKEARRVYKNGNPVYEHGEIIILLMYTGLRFSEMAALTWDDIDFEEEEIIINKTSVYTNVDGVNKFVDQDSTKTISGVRTVPILPEVKEALMNLQERSDGVVNYLMYTKNHKQKTPGTLNKCFARILRNAGIISKNETCGVHTLRHTYASMLFERGIDLKSISMILGHSSVKITSDIYTHMRVREVARKVKREVLMTI